jgi:hypothetical protein
MITPTSIAGTHGTTASPARVTADVAGPDEQHRRMSPVARWVVVLIVAAHGSIHLLGAAKGLGWADVTQLTEPVSTVLGVTWLTAATLLMTTAVLLACAARWWWVLGAVAALVSQGVISTSWSDAKIGTVANVLLLVVVTLGYTSRCSPPVQRGPAHPARWSTFCPERGRLLVAPKGAPPRDLDHRDA